jgi:hypothetical protein
MVCESGDIISNRIIIRAIEIFYCHMSKIYKRDWITGHICNWSIPELPYHSLFGLQTQKKKRTHPLAYSKISIYPVMMKNSTQTTTTQIPNQIHNTTN